MQVEIFVTGASHHNCRQLDVPTVGKYSRLRAVKDCDKCGFPMSRVSVSWIGRSVSMTALEEV